MLQKDTITWFEIPTTDIARAQKFYESMLNMTLQPVEMPGIKMAVFPGREDTGNDPLVHGALIQMEDRKPSNQGAMVYFNGGNDLADYLKNVEGAGGKIVQEKTSIGEHGFFAMFEDTEGNVLAIHSPN